MAVDWSRVSSARQVQLKAQSQAQKYNPNTASSDAREKAKSEGKSIRQKYYEQVSSSSSGAAKKAAEQKVELEQAKVIAKAQAGDTKAEAAVTTQLKRGDIREKFLKADVPTAPVIGETAQIPHGTEFTLPGVRVDPGTVQFSIKDTARISQPDDLTLIIGDKGRPIAAGRGGAQVFTPLPQLRPMSKKDMGGLLEDNITSSQFPMGRVTGSAAFPVQQGGALDVVSGAVLPTLENVSKNISEGLPELEAKLGRVFYPEDIARGKAVGLKDVPAPGRSMPEGGIGGRDSIAYEVAREQKRAGQFVLGAATSKGLGAVSALSPIIGKGIGLAEVGLVGGAVALGGEGALEKIVESPYTFGAVAGTMPTFTGPVSTTLPEPKYKPKPLPEPKYKPKPQKDFRDLKLPKFEQPKGGKAQQDILGMKQPKLVQPKQPKVLKQPKLSKPKFETIDKTYAKTRLDDINTYNPPKFQKATPYVKPKPLERFYSKEEIVQAFVKSQQPLSIKPLPKPPAPTSGPITTKGGIPKVDLTIQPFSQKLVTPKSGPITTKGGMPKLDLTIQPISQKLIPSQTGPISTLTKDTGQLKTSTLNRLIKTFDIGEKGSVGGGKYQPSAKQIYKVLDQTKTGVKVYDSTWTGEKVGFGSRIRVTGPKQPIKLYKSPFDLVRQDIAIGSNILTNQGINLDLPSITTLTTPAALSAVGSIPATALIPASATSSVSLTGEDTTTALLSKTATQSLSKILTQTRTKTKKKGRGLEDFELMKVPRGLKLPSLKPFDPVPVIRRGGKPKKQEDDPFKRMKPRKDPRPDKDPRPIPPVPGFDPFPDRKPPPPPGYDPPPVQPPIFGFAFPDFGATTRRAGKPRRYKPRKIQKMFVPSLRALGTGITSTKVPKYITGFEPRPIVKKKKKKKTRKKRR